jgi:tyrosinase
MIVRRNFTSLSDDDRQKYVRGVLTMKAQGTYDTYIKIHAANGSAAHRGPAFLPWHRKFLTLFEHDLQIAVGDPTYALPYWDWASDAPSPLTAIIWGENYMGGQGDPVNTGPFKRPLWVTLPPAGWIYYLRRIFPPQGAGLPTQSHVDYALTLSTYDTSPWDNTSQGSFRNTLEGWSDIPSQPAPNLHNLVHVWIGGNMGIVASSPNDPLFFLHHCNVDRIWALWQSYFPNSPYPDNVPPPRQGQNIDDPMPPWNTGPSAIATPRKFLNYMALGYRYDCTWQPLPQLLTQVSVANSAEIYGVLYSHGHHTLWRLEGALTLSNWTEVDTPFQSLQVSVGQDGSLFVVDTSRLLHSWNDSKQKFDTVFPFPGIEYVSVYDKDTLWAIMNDELRYSLDAGKHWNSYHTKMPKLKQVSVGADRSVWVLDSLNGIIHYLDVNNLITISSPTTLTMIQISALDHNTIWAIDSLNSLWKLSNATSNNPQWSKININFKPAAIAVGADQTMLGLDMSRNVYFTQ